MFGSIGDLWHLLGVIGIGLAAGILGGMLGVGGSVLIIPGLVILFGHDRTPGFNQHLYQACAMIANVAVSVPAALRHRKAGVIVAPVLRVMLPAALLFILAGVWLSNRPIFEGSGGGVWLARLLALFLFYEVARNIIGVWRNSERHVEVKPARITRPRSATVGAAMGTIGGLLGIGGGAIAVPLQQVLLHLPLRNAIANSSAIICITAGVGAIYKNATLDQHGVSWQDSLLLALALAPTAWLGGRLGASLTHRLPIRQVRIAFIVIMFAAAWKMAAIPL